MIGSFDCIILLYIFVCFCFQHHFCISAQNLQAPSNVNSLLSKSRPASSSLTIDDAISYFISHRVREKVPLHERRVWLQQHFRYRFRPSTAARGLFSPELHRSVRLSSLLSTKHHLSPISRIESDYFAVQTINVNGSCQTSADDYPIDREALIDLLRLSPFPDLPFAPGQSMCQSGLIGIGCVRVPEGCRITTISLANYELTGPIPSSIVSLSSSLSKEASRRLSVFLIPVLFSFQGQLSYLEVLDLSYNQLTDPLPQSLSLLSRLVELQLNFNPSLTLLPARLANITSLEILSFWNCRLVFEIVFF